MRFDRVSFRLPSADKIRKPRGLAHPVTGFFMRLTAAVVAGVATPRDLQFKVRQFLLLGCVPCALRLFSGELVATRTMSGLEQCSPATRRLLRTLF